MRALVTGGAGFIGSNLTRRLLEDGHSVVVYDNLSTGFEQFLPASSEGDEYRLIQGDILDTESLRMAMQGCDFVFHLAANADVRFGTAHPERDLQQNTIGTARVLEAMRATATGKIAFSSTGSVYGEPEIFPTPEDAPFPVQTSLYAASKVAGEGLIQAYSAGFGIQAWIFRFVSVLGEGYTHGHVFDFYRKLLADPTQLEVLGDGRQRKSYMHVQDCVDAMLLAIENAREPVNILNLGQDSHTEVNESIAIISEELGVTPDLRYTGGKRGWVGDSPFIFLDTTKIRGLGWKPKVSIPDGIRATLRWLQENHWVLEARS